MFPTPMTRIPLRASCAVDSIVYQKAPFRRLAMGVVYNFP
jgi:hypothetical protein